MSDGDSILAIFVLTIVVFGILEATVFYEPPSCVTTNLDPFEFSLSLFFSGMIAVGIYMLWSDLWKWIKEKLK